MLIYYESDAPLAWWPTFVAFPISLGLVNGDDTRQIDRLHHAVGSGLNRHCLRRFVFDLLVTHRLRFWGSACDGRNFLLVRRRRAYAGRFHYPRFSPPALSLAVWDETVAVSRFLSFRPYLSGCEIETFPGSAIDLPLSTRLAALKWCEQRSCFYFVAAHNDRRRNHGCHNSTLSPQAVVEELLVMWRQTRSIAITAFTGSRGCQWNGRAFGYGRIPGHRLTPTLVRTSASMKQFVRWRSFIDRGVTNGGVEAFRGGGTDLIVGYESDAQWPTNFVFPYRSWSDCDRTCLVAQTTSFELRWSFSRLSPFC